jgi:hypothetical protein
MASASTCFALMTSRLLVDRMTVLLSKLPALKGGKSLEEVKASS